jgi:hypothetical protein
VEFGLACKKCTWSSIKCRVAVGTNPETEDVILKTFPCGDMLKTPAEKARLRSETEMRDD